MAKREYPKLDHQFKLKRDLVIPAGTVFTRAGNERGGDDRVEAVVAFGADAVAWLNLPVVVARFDAAEWFEEVVEKK